MEVTNEPLLVCIKQEEVENGNERKTIIEKKPTARKTSMPPPFTRGTRNLISTTIERCSDDDDNGRICSHGKDVDDTDEDEEEMITGEVNDSETEAVDADYDHDDDKNDPTWKDQPKGQPLVKRKRGRKSVINSRVKRGGRPSAATLWNKQFPQVVEEQLKKRKKEQDKSSKRVGHPRKNQDTHNSLIDSVRRAYDRLKNGNVSKPNVSNDSRTCAKKQKIQEPFTIEKLYKSISKLVEEGEKLLTDEGSNYESLEDVCYHLNKCKYLLEKDVDVTNIDLDESDHEYDPVDDDVSSLGNVSNVSKPPSSVSKPPSSVSTHQLQFNSTNLRCVRVARKKNVPTLKATDYLAIDPVLKSDKSMAKRRGRPKKVSNFNEDSNNARDGIDDTMDTTSTANHSIIDDNTIDDDPGSVFDGNDEKEETDDDTIDTSDSDFEPPDRSKNPKKQRPRIKKPKETSEERLQRIKEKQLEKELRRTERQLNQKMDPKKLAKTKERRQRKAHQLRNDENTLIKCLFKKDPTTGFINEDNLYIYLKFDKQCPICNFKFDDKADYVSHEPCYTKRRRIADRANGLLSQGNDGNDGISNDGIQSNDGTCQSINPSINSVEVRKNPNFKHWIKDSRSSRDMKDLCLECGTSFAGRLDPKGLPVNGNAMLTMFKYHCYQHFEPYFTCKVCNETFNFEHEALEHSTIHEQFCSYECIGCRKEFDTLASIKEHVAKELKKIGNNKSFRGGWAPKHHLGFRDKEGSETAMINRPERIKNSMVPIIEECKRKLLRQRCIMYTCQDCPTIEGETKDGKNLYKLFHTKEEAEEHIKQVEGHQYIQLYKCNCVAKPFTDIDNFIYHVKWSDKHRHRGEWIPGPKRKRQSEWKRVKSTPPGRQRIRPVRLVDDTFRQRLNAHRFQDTDGPTIPVPEFPPPDTDQFREQLHFWVKQFFGYKAKPDDVPSDLSPYYPQIPFEETCQLCNQVFTAQNEFIVHDPCFFVKRSKQLMELGIQEGPRFQCDACAGAFSSLEVLQKHVSKHTVAQFKCIWDKIGLVNRPVDNRDLRGGRLEAPQGMVWRRDQKTCEWKLEKLGNCQMTFSTQAAARNHILMRHLSWKGYYCRFNEVTGIIDTTDGKPCDHRSYRTEDIRAHVLSFHINFKPHKCTECPFKTTDFTLLGIHRRAFHDVSMSDLFICPVATCTAKRKTFAERGGLFKHLKKVHPDYDTTRYREKMRVERNRKPGRKTIEGEGAIHHTSVKFKIVNGQTVLVDEEKDVPVDTSGQVSSTNNSVPTSSHQSSQVPTNVSTASMSSSSVVGGHITAAQTITEQAVAGLAMYQQDHVHHQTNQNQVQNLFAHFNMFQ